MRQEQIPWSLDEIPGISPLFPEGVGLLAPLPKAPKAGRARGRGTVLCVGHGSITTRCAAAALLMFTGVLSATARWQIPAGGSRRALSQLGTHLPLLGNRGGGAAKAEPACPSLWEQRHAWR